MRPISPMADPNELSEVNKSLSRVGCMPVHALDGQGPSGQIPGDVYFSVRDDLLSKYPWQFTLNFAAMTREADGHAGWKSAFRLPPDKLGLPRAFYASAQDDQPVKRYQFIDGKVHTETDALYCEYQRLPPVDECPPYFLELLRVAVAAELALSIREDQALWGRLRNVAYGSEQYQGEGGQFAVAKNLDGLSAPTKAAPTGGEELHVLRGMDFNDCYKD